MPDIRRSGRGRGEMNTSLRFLIVFFMASTVVWGQGSTSQINGTVRDASGLAVPGAAVKVTQTGTGAVRITNSGADGSYVFPDLPVGPYLLEVSKAGFSSYAQSGI